MNQVVGQHEVDVTVDVGVRSKVFVVATRVALANTSGIYSVFSSFWSGLMMKHLEQMGPQFRKVSNKATYSDRSGV